MTSSKEKVKFPIRMGKGRQTFPDGSIYDGYFKNGKPNGYGEYAGKEGEIYRGEFKSGLYHGKGTLEICEKGKFVGSWERGKLIRGTCHFLNASELKIYEGSFENYIPQGIGVLEYKDGKLYFGSIINGLEQGEGTMTYPNGDRYQGYFYNKLRYGYGRLTSKDGTYEGYWVNNKPAGWGMSEYSDGSSYQGYWEEGKYNGIGMKNTPGFESQIQGVGIEGMWKNGALNLAFADYWGKQKNIGQ